MTFAQSVKSVFKNYANFRGRARRSEFWWYYPVYELLITGFLILILVQMWNGVIFGPLFAILFIFPLLYVVLGIPYLAVSVRRLHDTGRSGYYLIVPWAIRSFASLFAGIMPVVGLAASIVSAVFGLVLIYFFAQEGERHDNQYGRDPKEPLTEEEMKEEAKRNSGNVYDEEETLGWNSNKIYSEK